MTPRNPIPFGRLSTPKTGMRPQDHARPPACASLTLSLVMPRLMRGALAGWVELFARPNAPHVGSCCARPDLLRDKFLGRVMDRRVKPGDDDPADAAY